MSYRILVTGCSSGIGRALVAELSSRGHEVIATARNVGSIRGIGNRQLALDVTDDASVEAVANAAGPIDVLVNNAGVGLWAPVEEVAQEQAMHLFDTNFFGALRMQRAFLPGMRERGQGQIIQVSSATGRVVGPLLGHYSASKHALEAMSYALRAEVAKFGIKVAIIELGAIESDFGKNRPKIAASEHYQPVIEHFTNKLMALRTAPTTSADTAIAIANVIDAGAPQIMVDGTPDATAIVEARRALSDEEWERLQLDGLI